MMRSPSRRRFVLAFMAALAAIVAAPATADAQTLDQARNAGLVGERFDGYIAAVSPNPAPEIAALVASVNAGRRAKYAEVAGRNNTSTEAVAALSAAKIVESLPPGTYVMDQSGTWRRK